mmetsp:Transcript_79746/g.207217  ORF Transcript_79746/g.207217 Transcript_79746/m.207217 type:complete len:1788 (+) Transcript_79746:125-5488(+)
MVVMLLDGRSSPGGAAAAAEHAAFSSSIGLGGSAGRAGEETPAAATAGPSLVRAMTEEQLTFHVPVPPPRPQSARGRSFGGNRRLGPRQMAMVPRRPPGPGMTVNCDSTTSLRRPDRPSSAGAARGKSPPRTPQPPVPAPKDGHDAMSALVLAMLQIYDYRSKGDVWVKLLEPLRSLVPCEDVKIVVRSIGAPREDIIMGPFDAESRPRARPIKLVEHWPQQRIEGHCALTQRICTIPSAEAERQHWHQYEVSNCGRPVNCESTPAISGPLLSSSSYLRCLVAVPLFDAAGTVLAVVKLINRRSWPEGHPRMEFSKADLAALSAFSAIFACVMPSPYLGLPGAAIPRRPEVQLWLTDDSIGALVRWQLQREFREKLVHEILYGSVEYEDEYAACRKPNQDHWNMLPCGILEPLPGSESYEPCFEYRVPGLQPGLRYAFSVRARNLDMDLEWSEPSYKLSTFLVPPHPQGSEAVALVPRTDNTVDIEWVPFQTCDPGLQLIEYRVVAMADQDEAIRDSLFSDGVEQVVAVFISDGSADREVATVSCLQNTGTYTFAIEARYPYLGTRSFTRALVSDKYSFPTVDLTLPAPQPLALDMVSTMSDAAGSPTIPGPLGSAVMVRWPYPADLTPKLILQYRTASLPMQESDPRVAPRMQISAWNRLMPGDGKCAWLRQANMSSEIRILQDPGLVDGRLAVQLRVVMQQDSAVSPPSSWFHARPPRPPEAVSSRLLCSDEAGVALRLEWRALPQDWLMSAAGLVESGSLEAQVGGGSGGQHELGPVSYAVCHDFSRGHGPNPTQFQVRLRFAAERAGAAEEEWEELPPQLLPPAVEQEPTAPLSRWSHHAWDLQDQRWFSRPDAVFEVQVRHGNALFWSAWANAGSVQAQVRPPTLAAGHALRMEDIRTDSVRLLWPPFQPSEEGLRDLEYRILCLELPDGGDARPEAGGRVVAWRTLDVVVADYGEEGEPPASLHYVVRSLLPDRRYLFGVECRYLGLPSGLAATAASRLEAAEPLPRRAFSFTVLPDGFAAHAALLAAPAPTAVAELAAGGSGGSAGGRRGGLRLHLRWRFRVLPPGTPVPPVLAYQLCCVPAVPDRDGALPPNVPLQPALLVERSRSQGGAACFTVDRNREGASAEAELCASAIETMVSASRLQFVVRVGDPSSNTWSLWSEALSDVVDLTVLPPVAPDGAVLQVSEELWTAKQSGTLPRRAPHAVEAVNLAWPAFQAAPGLAPEQHLQLFVQYEVVVWRVDPAASKLAEVQGLLRSRDSNVTDALVVFRQALQPGSAQAREVHRFQVPGDSLHPGKHHYFQVVARYFFPDGSPLPEPKEPVPGQVALVSAEPYRPTPRNPGVPSLEPFSVELGQTMGRCAILQLHGEEGVDDPTAITTDVAAEPLTIEVREGRSSAWASSTGGAAIGNESGEGAIVAVGSWTAVPQQAVQALGGDKTRLLVRDLAVQVCQFRVRRGVAESRPSAFTDTCVWRPLPLVGDQLCAQMRSVASGGRRPGGQGPLALQGLGVAMGVGADTTLFARLMWPRHAPQAIAVSLSKYQVRYRTCGGEWHDLPMVDLPSSDAVMAECQVSELQYGHLYEFALRLGNALGRWSDWSPPTTPLRLELPPPVPGRSMERGGLRVAVVSSSKVKLVWRPFSVPCRSERMEAPILLDPCRGQRGNVCADYEVIMHGEDGSVLAVVQREAPAVFEDLHSDNEAATWIEADLPLESQRSCSFEIRARLRKGAWGASVRSPPLPARMPSSGPLALTAPPALGPPPHHPAPREEPVAHLYPTEPIAA